eukprot:CAMPEP_0198113980 /NCGR_PEP_ID=MMETSP1442-20131203/5503_1 /TAXON_ID= /ORGANISM="Craspedostauros australis, Strain CCMP3328" /LENGTH=176 /DNA_ID=CAMNT_0043771191 /DNA_START=248 /DNA_END=779 /DNA_ORIENTATION=-
MPINLAMINLLPLHLAIITACNPKYTPHPSGSLNTRIQARIRSLDESNGDCYEGTFVYDARHGSGTYTWKNGNVYEGDFFEDKRQGNGKFLFANGNTYDGEFVNGVFEGLGRYEFEGGFYEGQWKSGRYHGKGLLLFTDGSSYKGDFKDGVAHGRGQETDAQGGIRSGYWKEGIAI